MLHKPSIIAVSETWFSVNQPAYNLPNFDLFNKDRIGRAGGVALYVESNLSIISCNITVPDDLEYVWLLIKGNYAYNIKYLLLCSVYYPPEAPHHDELYDHLTATVDSIRSQYDDVLVALIGDLNRFDKENLCTDLGLINVV